MTVSNARFHVSSAKTCVATAVWLESTTCIFSNTKLTLDYDLLNHAQAFLRVS